MLQYEVRPWQACGILYAPRKPFPPSLCPFRFSKTCSSLILPSPSFTQPLHTDTCFRLIIDLDSRPRQLVDPPGAQPFFPWYSFLPVHALEFVSLAESCSAPHMFYFVQLWTQDWLRQMPRNVDTKRSEIELGVRTLSPVLLDPQSDVVSILICGRSTVNRYLCIQWTAQRIEGCISTLAWSETCAHPLLAHHHPPPLDILCFGTHTTTDGGC